MLFAPIFANLNLIILIVWLVFFLFVLTRYLRPRWFGDVGFGWIAGGAALLHVLIALFITWGQYHVWATGSDFTRVFLTAPLSPDVPLPSLFEWTRGYFEQPLGYFAYYAMGHFFFDIGALFIVSGIVYIILKVWGTYRGALTRGDAEMILTTLLVSGWPGVLLAIPLGFLAAIVLFLLPRGNLARALLRAFLFAAAFSLLFAKPVFAGLGILHLLVV